MVSSALSAVSRSRLGVALGPAVAVLLLAAVGGALLRMGPDAARYLDWARVTLELDPFLHDGATRSPFGVPVAQWSFGPGVLAALGSLLVSGTPEQGMRLAGWIAGVVFWVALRRILRHCAGGRRSLELFGLSLAFVGTHAGYYAFSAGSESLSLCLGALVLSTLLPARPPGIVDALLVGVSSALLVVVRSQLGIYVVVALAVLLARLARAGPGPLGRRLGIAACAVLPVAVAAAEVLWVQRWMTGSLLASPYVFGADGFRSVDLAHPELAAVLWHPWHGLLAYHPAYLPCFVALLWWAARGEVARRALAGLVAVALCLHVWLHASWYCWWLGRDTFGMRGLAVASVALLPAMIAFLEARLQAGRPIRLWLGLLSASACWSCLLLGQGESNFTEASALGQAQLRALAASASGVQGIAAGAALGSLTFRVALLRRTRREVWLPACALGMTSLALLALGQRLLAPRDSSPFSAAIGILALGLAGVAPLLPRPRPPGRSRGQWTRPLGCVVLSALLAGTTGLFLRLAVATERAHATGALERPHDRFRWTGALNTEEVVECLDEYASVPGFEPRKAALRRFVDRWLAERRIPARGTAPAQ